MPTTRSSPAPGQPRRLALAEFLKARRAQLAPVDHGFGAGGRRRTPGLRREELAQLCDISTTWYTWIEQGRDVAVSSAVLARFAQVLRLTPAERAYLFKLSGKPDQQPGGQPEPADIPDALRRAVRRVGSPAYVLGRDYEPLAWNAAAVKHFGAWLRGRPRPQTLLEYMFLDPAARSFVVQWPLRARRLVAEFRADASDFLEQPALQARLAQLAARSPEFRRLWRLQDVVEREGGVREFNHPRQGPLRYEQVNLRLAQRRDIKLVILVDAPAAGNRKDMGT
jgi:transcriptional regulator with XRE-family HTH domain